jgi:hypothetical protein
MGFSSPPPPCFVVDGFANSSSSTTALPLRTSLNGRGSSPLDDRERRLSPSGRKVVIFEAGGVALFSVTFSKGKKREEKNFEEAKRRGEQKKITPSFENEKRKKRSLSFLFSFFFAPPSNMPVALSTAARCRSAVSGYQRRDLLDRECATSELG